ncbi:hypothetical protein Cgig2_008175 [Carnegiea gigantea]|uniref:Uncharacterized protein n=1 Tax=Carnegiea gigantea TaxID=171969 RepID=A0A9Q1L2P5_9CARY|nr:hypothetical protein Cgig2_008175 [Carnegiea gigantea]
MASITSAEMNYLVFRYLHESVFKCSISVKSVLYLTWVQQHKMKIGFTHSAFAFGYEAGINSSTIDGNLVPPGALVRFVQKGLQYLELESNLSSVGSELLNDADLDDGFSLLQPLDLITKDIYELQKIIKEKKRSIEDDKHKERDKVRECELDYAHESDMDKRTKEKAEPDKDRTQKDKELKVKDEEKLQVNFAATKPCEDEGIIPNEGNETSGGAEAEPMDISTNTESIPCEISSCDVTVLEGHASEVFACAWSPTGSLLASGSGDSTARIWTIADGPSTSAVYNGLLNVAVLKHFKGRTNEKSKDVTTLDWNSDGTLLATGSYDGQARIWSKDGDLKCTLNRHKGPVFSLKWNKKGDYLLSGSVDKTAIVWDVKTGECKQQFEFHTGDAVFCYSLLTEGSSAAPTLDVDWRNNVSFATCSTDNMIYVCKLGDNRPIKTFSGHQGEVNAIKWDPIGSLLASCSDDCTSKIWSIKQDKYVHDLREHSKVLILDGNFLLLRFLCATAFAFEIYTIKWSPTGPGTSNPNQQLILASPDHLITIFLPLYSASFDSTIKLWDVELGNLLCSLNGHREPVYSIAFSPNGEYVASGSLDKCVHLWSVKEGRIVKTYTGNGGIFEVCWNKEGDKIAACFANNVVCVLDVRM